MNAITASIAPEQRAKLWAGPIIDIDVHARVPNINALLPHFEPVWKQFLNERGWRGPNGPSYHTPPAAPSSARDEWRPADGTMPASSIDLLQKHILDPWRTERAILNCYYGVDSLRHPDWAAALARAVNDWIIKEWLDKDDRLRASMVVPARSPTDMIKEIDRVGGHPGFVQVLMPVRSDRLYGNRIFHPVYEAMVRHNLVFGLQRGGTTEGAPTPTGYPSWFIEEQVGEIQVYTSQITSLIAEGVFQVYPDLRVSVLDAGFAWVPQWNWHMDKEWKGLRREIPWVNKRPTELVRQHFRFSIAPLDAGPPAHMAQILEWMGSDDMLMFATDYPYYHDDDIGAFLALMPESMRPKVMSETARNWYRL